MKNDTLTLTVSRGNWRITRILNLADLDLSRYDYLDDTIELMRHDLESSWRQLPPAMKKALLEKSSPRRRGTKSQSPQA